MSKDLVRLPTPKGGLFGDGENFIKNLLADKRFGMLLAGNSDLDKLKLALKKFAVGGHDKIASETPVLLSSPGEILGIPDSLREPLCGFVVAGAVLPEARETIQDYQRCRARFSHAADQCQADADGDGVGDVCD